MAQRIRTTWAVGGSRKASAPPALPGYGTEDQDHPAHYPDPGPHDYENGDTSAWAEDPASPPYKEGPPPALPGYDTEDQDHPAHVRHQRFAASRKTFASLEKKADSCLRVASAIFGKSASEAVLTRTAATLMDVPAARLAAAEQTLTAGGFLATFDEDGLGFDDPSFDEMVPGMDLVDDVDLLDDADPFGDSLFAEPEELRHLQAQIRRLQAKVAEMEEESEDEDSKESAKKASRFARVMRLAEEESEDEGDEGEEESDKAANLRKMRARKAAEEESEDEDSKESAKKASKTARIRQIKAARLFKAMDLDGDGFILAEDWPDSGDLFTACGADDGILAEEDFMSAMADMDLDDAEMAMLKKAEEEKSEEEEGSDKEAASEEEKEGSDKEATIAALRARLAELEGEKSKEEKGSDKEASDEEESKEDEGSDKEASEEEEGEDEGSDKEDEEEDDMSKEAAALFAGVHESMDFSSSPTVTAAEQAALDSYFGVKTAGLKPQPKLPSNGVSRLGGVSRVASSSGIEDLSKLWTSAPDVSEVFSPR